MTASLLERVSGADPDGVYDGFVAWAQERGLSLYAAQDEAVIELVSGSNVILATPTGTGKSLVAVAAHAAAVASGRRTYYTAPIKALVSEKFFALVDVFGPEQVGMVTGDSSVNPDAPIVCCTAEILANMALRHGADTGPTRPEAPGAASAASGGGVGTVDQVVMDEFHFYGDPDRGWAWQVPLLLMPHAQFLLMSATLGDVTAIRDDLTRRTGRPTALVAGAERPVPLRFSYERRPVHEVVELLLRDAEVPVYIVHFSQAAAIERAQALSSMKIASRAQRDEIAEALGDFRFSTGFGKTLSRLVRAGIGVHHAGMLPRYRRLVETLAQRGLLKVICGTDTLGVGINVPIRTVLITELAKYDGTRMRQLSAREFHQVAGRAGRAGFDPYGNVIVMAPAWEIENAAALAKAADNPSKRKKIVRKKAPTGAVNWGKGSFDRLVAASPEPLVPQLELTAAMLINVIARGGDVFSHVRALVFDNHQTRMQQFALARRALAVFRTLRDAGIVEVDADSGAIRLTVDLQPNFALNQPLSPFALAAIDLLDPEDGPGAAGTGHYAMDVVSVIESTLDDPRAILNQQEHRARGEAVGAMKAEGLDYEQRMAALEEITYPKPLDELLHQSFEVFASSQPWVRDFELSPKAVVRDMFERAASFSEYVSLYQLARSEGLVLRYLSDAYRAIRQTVPQDARTDELLDVIEWLGEVVRQVDSSLVDEWEQLAHPTAEGDEPARPPAPTSVVANRRAFTVLVRNELFRRVQLAALQRDDELVALDPDAAWPGVLDRYFAEHDEILTGGPARSPQLCAIDESDAASAGIWRVEQTIDDPAGDHDWRIRAEVDLEQSADAGAAVVRVTEIVRL